MHYIFFFFLLYQNTSENVSIVNKIDVGKVKNFANYTIFFRIVSLEEVTGPAIRFSK